MASEFCKSDAEDIKAKCEQYWNEHGICDAEVHVILEFIHKRANNLESQLSAARAENERLRELCRLALDHLDNERHKETCYVATARIALTSALKGNHDH